MLRVGLTGGIGAGKSTVAARLAELGAVVVDADRVAREVVQSGTPGLAAVVAAFGDGVLTTDGTLDRPALGRLVFSDPDRLRTLNGILHPLIARRTGELMAAAPPDAVVVHDVPLLVENRLAPGYHLAVVVHAPQEERVRRLVADRGMAEADARARVAAQATDDERRAAADVWLDNAGPAGAVIGVVDRLWRERLVPFEANVRLRRRAERAPAVVVVDPDPTWAAQAARLTARISVAVGGEAVRIDHTGSTAVPGLPAKDVVDLQVVVAELRVADTLGDRLADAGFARLPGDWWDDDIHDGGRLPKRLHAASDPGRAVNLHMRAAGGPAWRWQLLFRDWLRAHPQERDAYAAVKRQSSGVDIEAYMAAKGPWIVEALRRAQEWALATAWTPAAPLVGRPT